MMSKVGQKVTHGRRPQLGATEAAQLVLAHWRASPVVVCARCIDLPMLNRQWVEGLVKGEHGAAPTTVAFLVNLLAPLSPTGGEVVASDAVS